MIGRAWRFVSTVIGIIFRHPIVGTTVIPVLPDGKIVLIQRSDTKQWGLPGGMVDWGEDVSTAVVRELKEETGLDTLKIRRLVGVYSAPDRDPRIHSISVAVEVEVDGVMEAEDKLEVLQVKGFERSEIPLGDLCHDHDRQLQDYFQGGTMLA